MAMWASLRRAGCRPVGRTLRTSTCQRYPTSEDERYIQTTRVPTLHFQPSLPRLPIPGLKDTCTRYLDALAPVTSPEQFSRTQSIVSDFGGEGGDGEALNKLLHEVDSQNKHTSYISGPWYDMYLASRDPVVLNHNPFMAWKPDAHTSDQCERAVNFIHAAVLFRNALEDGLLEPDIFHLNPQKSDTELFRNIVRLVPSSFSWYMAYLWKAFPLDMSQYPHLFCSTRLPYRGRDKLASHPGHMHVVVMRNGHFYSLPAAQSNGIPVSSQSLHHQLRWILEQPSSPPSHPLSYFSASDRDWWATVRQELEGVNEANRQALATLDSAMFVLCLDDAEVTNEIEATHTLLHNYGANRWFDKSFNLIVTKNGLSAINFEHSWGDGVAVLRFFNELYKYTTTNPYIPKSGVQASGEGVEKLEFQLTDSLRASIDKARACVEEKCGSLSVSAVQYDRYGSDFIKSSGLRADPVIQLAIQVAYYRQHGELVPSYESCSTAAFRHGRTETIRPATSAAKSCAELMQPSHPAGRDEMMAAVMSATNTHFNLTRNAAMGQGFDRHLFALHTLAKEAGKDLQIFKDPSYQHLNHIVLSTSTLSAEHVLIGGFAPVTPDGYGIGYNVSSNHIGYNVLTYPSRDGAQLTACLQDTLDDLHCLMTGKNFK